MNSLHVLKKIQFTPVELKEFLDSKVDQFNRPDFIENDPISIPHLFSNPQDIEIAGLFASVLAWGQRVTIINKCKDILNRMDQSPYEFILHHRKNDLKRLEGFKHRTFNETDLLYFVTFLRQHYKKHDSLEDLFPMSFNFLATRSTCKSQGQIS